MTVCAATLQQPMLKDFSAFRHQRLLWAILSAVLASNRRPTWTCLYIAANSCTQSLHKTLLRVLPLVVSSRDARYVSCQKHTPVLHGGSSAARRSRAMKQDLPACSLVRRAPCRNQDGCSARCCRSYRLSRSLSRHVNPPFQAFQGVPVDESSRTPRIITCIALILHDRSSSESKASISP